jgi:hypothetical protein
VKWRERVIRGTNQRKNSIWTANHDQTTDDDDDGGDRGKEGGVKMRLDVQRLKGSSADKRVGWSVEDRCP